MNRLLFGCTVSLVILLLGISIVPLLAQKVTTSEPNVVKFNIVEPNAVELDAVQIEKPSIHVRIELLEKRVHRLEEAVKRLLREQKKRPPRLRDEKSPAQRQIEIFERQRRRRK